MENCFQTTNNVAKIEFCDIRHMKPGRVFFQEYKGVHIAFVKLAKPIPAGFACSRCGQAVWNAHNFSNAVHFCPGYNYKLEISEFIIDFPTS